MGGNSTFNSPGKCKAAPTSGVVQARISGVGFVAKAAVAVVDHGMISLSAQAGDPLVVLYAPAAGPRATLAIESTFLVTRGPFAL